MEAFLWLLTQMLLPLTAVAAVFLTLGWRWGQAKGSAPLPALQQRLDAEDQASAALRLELEELRAAELSLREARTRLQQELSESQEREAHLQKEILRLTDALASTPQPPPPAASTPASPRTPTLDASSRLAALKSQAQQARAELAALLTEQDVWSQQESAAAGKGGDRRVLTRARKKLERIGNEITKTTSAAEAFERQAAFLAAALAESIAEGDDLTRISGIKGATARQLQEHGFRTYRQLACWTEDDLDTVGALLGVKNRPRREHWVEQAQRLLAEKQGSDA